MLSSIVKDVEANGIKSFLSVEAPAVEPVAEVEAESAEEAVVEEVAAE